MRIVQAIKNNIVVEVLKEVKKTEGGIILPDTASGDPQKFGKVLSVGKDVEIIKEGDIIVFHANIGGQAIIIDRKILKVLKDDEVYGILKEVEEEGDK